MEVDKKEIIIDGRIVTVEELIEISIDGHMEMLRAQITGQEAGAAFNKVLITLGENNKDKAGYNEELKLLRKISRMI